MKKRFKSHIKMSLWIFVTLFTVTIVYLGYSILTYGDEWFNTQYNPRIQSSVQAAQSGKNGSVAGSIYDRTGVKLAWTDADGTRVYHEKTDVRRSMSHVIGDTKGMTVGAESVFVKYLYGINKDLADKFGSILMGASEKGSDIVLTVDAGLTEYIYDNMDERRGCVVVMNYETGEILANVSIPTFDPNNLDLDELADTGLVDRAVMGRYAPGSLMKIVTATAAIERGIDFEYKCTGEEIIDGQKITCVKKHKTNDLAGAFEKSCNCYFAVLANRLGADVLEEKAEEFGFNRDFGFDDVVLYRSNFESTDNGGDIAWAGIGQYKDLVTPLHACMIAAAIANDGVMMEPKLLLDAVSGSYQTYGMQSASAGQACDNAVAAQIKEYMRGVVTDGTGTSAGVKGAQICGKTGTAEYYDEDEGKVKNHSWFAGFIDDGSYPYAVAVIYEGAGYGSKYAAPMAGKIFGYLLENMPAV